MAGESRFDRGRAGRSDERRDHDRDAYRGPDYGRGRYGRAGNIDYGGYPEAAIGHGRGGAGRGGPPGEGSLGYGHGGRIDYGGYPKGAIGYQPARAGGHGRGVHGGLGFGGDLEGIGEHRGRGPLGYTRSDERIREDVCDRLTDDPDLDASEIEVQVNRGEVTLSGRINRRMDKRLAEDIAEEVSGVRHVQNNLRLRHAGPYGTADETGAATRLEQDGGTDVAPANEPNAGGGRSAA